jgi:Transcriptional regulators
MNYESLAHEYLDIMYAMRGRNAQKRVNDSMHGEAFVLSYVSEHEGNVIPSDISNAMGITSARVAAALNGLEGKGLVTRRIDTEDRRRILIDLTDAGREKVQEQKQMMVGFVTGMLQYLGENDAKEYIRIMKKLADRNPEDFR